MGTSMSTINAHITDMRGVYLYTEQVDPMGPQPAGAIYNSDGDTLPEMQEGRTRMRIGGAWVQVHDADVPPLLDVPETVQAVPTEVPRWAGLLALKRHELRSSELLLLASDDDGANSLHAAVLAYRAGMPAGEARDRLDVALNDAKDWLLTSPTVHTMCSVLQLTDAQRDALFVWAAAQVGTV